MTEFQLYALTAIGLLGISLYALLTRTHLVRRILALNIMGSSAFLLLVAIARRNAIERADPVPHALVLTGVVVAVGMTAVALSVVRSLDASSGVERLSDLDEDDRP
jgi:multicomponent Na+:H+ antiporter subunit C